MKRILHVIQTLDPAAGGPPAICAGLVKAQLAGGWSAAVLTSSSSPTDGLKNLPVYIVRSPRPIDLLIRRSSRTEVAARVAEADVIHMHGIWDPLLHEAANQAARLGVRYVVMPHGMLDPWSLSQKRLKKHLALTLFVRRYLNRAAALHWGTDDEQRLSAWLRLIPKSAVIPNGVNLAEIDSHLGPGSFHRKRPLLSSAPYVLFLGRLHFKKGLDILAEAFAALARRHPAVQLVVAGPDGGEKAPFEQSVTRLGVSDRVILAGPLYGRDKWEALAGAACFCLPSRQEGFSVAVLEALACRVPVVISNHCHFDEVERASAGVIVPLNAEQLADALESTLADTKRSAEMGAAGRRLIETRYTWDRVASATCQLYESLRIDAGPTRNALGIGELAIDGAVPGPRRVDS
jgi:glycosyltransferase involved in cell wall biosynthesis